MPRCYMVKKALCNKYISSVARGFESRGRGRSTPSPTNVQPPVSPLEGNPYPVALQEVHLSEEKEKSPASTERSPTSRLQRVQDVIENAIDQCTETLVEKSPKRCLQRVQDVIENAIDQCTETLVEKPPKRCLQRVQDVIENAIDQCTETLVEKSPKRCLQRVQAVIENSVDQRTETLVEKSPKKCLQRVQDVIEDVIEQCNPPAVTTATTTVISCAGAITTTILQPAEFPTSTPPPKHLEEALTRPESTRPTKFTDDVRLRQTSPPSPTEGFTPRLAILSPYKNPTSLTERFNRSNFDSPARLATISKEYQNTNQEIPLFKDRSAAETEAAHDLLELSRSLPPLPQPSVAIGPQNVIELPATDVQEMTVYQPAEQPVYQVNTILASDLTNSGIYQHHQTGIIYDPTTTNTTTFIQQAPGGAVFIPLSPVQEILLTYSTPSVPTSIITQQTIETVPPLTPPTSECSSDIENNNPNSQPSQRDKEVQTITEQSEVKVAAAYTYDTLLVADGRSKNKKAPSQQKDTPEAEPVDSLEVPKAGRYICCECGKQYATSSNLSRHKQTHRSIDSQSAKKCVYCGKAYVSMPALAMHVLTHKLTHSCGVCGKMFSRPWLLQGHLRSHTGEKPYGCAHCGKAFADRSNLRAHMQTHSADKNYECSKCRKSFALKSYLNKHLESACQRENGDESSNDVEVSSS